jgi:adenylosuccinate lyase
MIPRYTTPEMRRLWSPRAKFQTWLTIEVLACEAMGELGLIPAEAAKRIRQRARIGSIRRIEEIEEKETKHDVVAFLRVVSESLGDDARYLHFGLGSSDIVDTALAVLMKKAADLLLRDLQNLMEEVRRLAVEHRDTLMVGRTHGVHAEPITFGLKMALWLSELQRHQRRLEQARETIAVGKLSGEVGTYAHLDPRVEAYVCTKLGLRPAPVSSQILQRDRHAEYMSALALLASSLEKFATEIRNLQRTEIREVEEPFQAGQTGSSAMPHKRNPITCERIAGLARLVRAYALAAMENVALWHERDITHSSVERVAIPDATSLVHYMLRKLTSVLKGLHVYPEQMRRNLARTGGLIFSHRLLLRLVEKGLSREEAYATVQAAAMKAWRGEESFQEALLASGAFTPEEIEECFDLRGTLRYVDEILRKVGIEDAGDPGV